MRLLVLFFFIVTLPLCAHTSLYNRLVTLAHACSSASGSLPNTDEEKRLDTIATACLDAYHALKHNDDAAAVKILLSVTRHEPIRSMKPVSLPVERIIEMLERQEVDVHLQPTTLQLSAKRMLFQTFIELFYTFGKSKLALQRTTNHALNIADREDQSKPLTHNPFRRSWHYLKSELTVNRASIGLRALRIMSSEFIDELTPNPKAKRWQMFMELLAPIAIAHIITYALLRDKNESIKNHINEALQEMVFRLFVVQFFIQKFNASKITIMVAIYFLAFYNSSAGNRIWKSLEEKDEESALALRQRYLTAICYTNNGRFNQENFISVLVDGLMSMALYRCIDTGVKKIKLPKWLHLTPVTQQACLDDQEEYNAAS